MPKSNGSQRPLGTPTVRDRVAQMAVVLVAGPLFEADLLPQQYGFRPGGAKMAVRRVYWLVTQQGKREVVDAPHARLFTSIPHSPLLRCLARRIADGRVLKTVKRWMTAPVVDLLEHYAIHASRPRVSAAAPVRFPQYIHPADLVPERVKAKGRFCLGLRL